MNMKIKRFANASEFLQLAGDVLVANEVQYGLMHSLATRLAINPNLFGSELPWFLAVTDSHGVCAAALRTPPHNLALAYFSGNQTEIAELIAKAIVTDYGDIPGVIGEPLLAEKFADLWSKNQMLQIAGKMNQRIYKLESVNAVALPPGKFRAAETTDKPIVSEWSAPFHAEAFGPYPKMPIDRIENRIDSQDLYVWEHSGLVSMAGKARPIGGGISVGPVYTPPEHRRKGYASACVSSLCSLLLESGYKYCALYTDLSNPTSNSIYQKIGFNPAYDSVQIQFASI
jgi:uncharacterized protein